MEKARGNMKYDIRLCSLDMDKMYNIYKSDKTLGAMQVAETTLHETTHLFQHYSSEHKDHNIKNITDSRRYEYTKEFLSHEYAGDLYYKEDDNYLKHSFEIDARNNSIDACFDMFKKAYGKEMTQTFSLNRLERMLDDEFRGNEQMDFLWQKYDKDELTTAIVNEMVESNPKLLKKYPLLSIEYNADGTRKSCYQLVKEQKEEIIAIRRNNRLTKKEKEEKTDSIIHVSGEAFLYNINRNGDDLNKCRKLIGDEELRIYCQDTQKHFERKRDELLKRAQEEEEIRNKFSSQSEEQIFMKRVERNKGTRNKYNDRISTFEDVKRFLDNATPIKAPPRSVRKKEDERIKGKIDKNLKYKTYKDAEKPIEKMIELARKQKQEEEKKKNKIYQRGGYALDGISDIPENEAQENAIKYIKSVNKRDKNRNLENEIIPSEKETP